MKARPSYAVIVLCAICLAACDKPVGVTEWPMFSIVYHANDGSDRTETVDREYGAPLHLNDSMTRQGHSLLGWAASPDGGADDLMGSEAVLGMVARPGDTLDLYAVWRAHIHTVVYDSNNGSGYERKDERVFTFGRSKNLAPLPAAFLPPEPDLVFVGWARYPEGLVLFRDGQSVINLSPDDNALVRLYAMWGEEIFTVSFAPNGGKGEGPPDMPGVAGESVTLPGSHGFLNEGHSFGGWNTLADGSGYMFMEGDTFIPSGDTTLYAMWSLTLSFAPNGGTGIPPDSLTVFPGVVVTIPGPGGLERTGHLFAGWNGAADGSGRHFVAGDGFVPDGDTTLHATWTVTVAFGPNGGTGTGPGSLTARTGSGVTIPGQGGLEREGYRFMGWGMDAEGANVGFPPGGVFVVGNFDVTLHAVWARLFAVRFVGNGYPGAMPGSLIGIYGEEREIPNLVTGGGVFFDRWNSDADAGGTGFMPGNMIRIGSADTIMYAIWFEFDFVAGTIRGLAGGTSRDISIPSAINGTPVSSVGAFAFAGGRLNSVAISQGLASIGDSAFAGNMLISVVVPAGVSAIGNSAFRGNMMESVVMPGGLGSIGAFAFAGNRLNSVVIPAGVTVIGNSAFQGNMLESVVLPGGVTDIGAFAFAGNRLGSVAIPSGVASIGDSAFQGNLLGSVVVPPGVASIGSAAFAHNRIASVVIPAGAAIGNFAFLGNALVSITMPAGLIITGDAMTMGHNGAAFVAFYDNGGRMAGTYSFANGAWIGPAP